MRIFYLTLCSRSVLYGLITAAISNMYSNPLPLLLLPRQAHLSRATSSVRSAHMRFCSSERARPSRALYADIRESARYLYACEAVLSLP